MSPLTITLLALFLFTAHTKDLPKSDSPTEIEVHATNRTSVPSVHYLVDAVELLKQAYGVYTDAEDRAVLYAELFQEKHNETEWNVVIGYSAAYIKSQWYVETEVTDGGKSKSDKDEKSSLYLIFSTV